VVLRCAARRRWNGRRQPDGKVLYVIDRCGTLITLTRLNDSRFVVNAELIRTIEERPDTTIVLVNGETMIVKEPMDQVVAKAIEYGRMVRMFPG